LIILSEAKGCQRPEALVVSITGVSTKGKPLVGIV
jgi:hypothetical protein